MSAVLVLVLVSIACESCCKNCKIDCMICTVQVITAASIGLKIRRPNPCVDHGRAASCS